MANRKPFVDVNGRQQELPTGDVLVDGDGNPIGGGIPGGSNTQIQFNDGGAFNGTPSITIDKTTGNVALLGAVNSNNVLSLPTIGSSQLKIGIERATGLVSAAGAAVWTMGQGAPSGGTNKGTGIINFYPGKGTGSGSAPGWSFFVNVVGVSGSTDQVQSQALSISNSAITVKKPLIIDSTEDLSIAGSIKTLGVKTKYKVEIISYNEVVSFSIMPDTGETVMSGKVYLEIVNIDGTSSVWVGTLEYISSYITQWNTSIILTETGHQGETYFEPTVTVTDMTTSVQIDITYPTDPYSGIYNHKARFDCYSGKVLIPQWNNI
jgi:hypothetical protein